MSVVTVLILALMSIMQPAANCKHGAHVHVIWKACSGQIIQQPPHQSTRPGGHHSGHIVIDRG